MGEVRVPVRLTNTFDEQRVELGLLAAESIRRYAGSAVVDTGAVRNVLPPKVARDLGLRIVGYVAVAYADGRSEEVPITGSFRIELEGREDEDNALILGDDVLIGQTALEKLDLLVDCHRQKLIANPANPNQPVNKIRQAT
jgi:clan AA aspartic protease